MNEKYLINNIVVKNYIIKRYNKCLYKKEEDKNNVIIFLYKYCKYYKEWSCYEGHKICSEKNQKRKKVSIEYTNDRKKKLKNIKNRMLKYMIIYNFPLLFYMFFVFIIIYFFLLILLFYNNKHYIQCTIPFDDCPLILHAHLNNFLKNTKINNISKENIYLFYKNMLLLLDKNEKQNENQNENQKKNNKQIKDTTNNKKNETKKDTNHKYYEYQNYYHYNNIKKDNIKDIYMLKKKKIYKILNTQKVTCTHCEIIFNIINDETIDDILNFYEVNKCIKQIDKTYCINIKDDTIYNKKIHIYKKYTGPIRQTNHFDILKKHKNILSRYSYHDAYMKEKVVIRNRIKYLYPFLQDYFLNLDYFKLYDNLQKKIEVNEESLRKFSFLYDKSLNLCRSSYKKKYSTFFWICPNFYKEKKNLHEYKISKMIEEFLNFHSLGYAHKNKHMIEMSKSNPLRYTYKHFGYIKDMLKLPFRVDIYNRFKILENEFLVTEIIEQMYKAFFCDNQKKNKEHIKSNVKRNEYKKGQVNNNNNNSNNNSKHSNNYSKDNFNLDNNNRNEYKDKEVLHREVSSEKLAFFPKEYTKKINLQVVLGNKYHAKNVDRNNRRNIIPHNKDNKKEQVINGNNGTQTHISNICKNIETDESEGEYDDYYDYDVNSDDVDGDDVDGDDVDGDDVDGDDVDGVEDKYYGEDREEISKVHKKYKSISEIKDVLIEEVPKTYEQNNPFNYKNSKYKFSKEIVIISSSIFFGHMKNMFNCIFYFVCLLLVIQIVLILLYIYIKTNDEVSIILKDKGHTEEISNYLKRLSKYMLNKRYVNTNMDHFKSGRHMSSVN
ncbi:conserved Plasmodium protein, unknown function [Plasmodium gaboni]|uniref:Uncharacterized protein n=1 Tax=Plasmodium gaboni TaxID=647221 RepID=A0ABY1UNG1_9APIC|nr:conserved Plasmodium protein, unknown function [Plasmodium gaboni]